MTVKGNYVEEALLEVATSGDEDMIYDVYIMMYDRIEDLKTKLGRADEALVELYNEANDLEEEINTLEDHYERAQEEYEQIIFDLQEDLVDGQQDYNELMEMYAELSEDFNAYTGIEEEDGWETFHVSGVSL
jgi:archaellum component FlaC